MKITPLARISKWIGILGLGWLTLVMASCGSTRTFTYMQGSFDTAKLSQIPVVEPIIHKGDLLSIIVYSDNPQATAIYNQPLISTGASNAGSGGSGSTPGTNAAAGPAPTAPGYLVDEQGNIVFQQIGTLHVEGLTRSSLIDTLNAKIGSQFNHPYYNIRFLNYRFTMLGEINRPGIYSIPGDRISLFEAIGMAGDLTFYGRRDNVLVIRENSGHREFARLDLTKPEVMSSPYYYLEASDMVIVEQTKKKIAANDQTTVRTITIAATLISTFAILYTIFK
jgi:polysaccharide export outer membrane protein